MARRDKIDRSVSGRLDEFERRLFVLKVQYEKYFNGVDPLEPLRERDDLRRTLRELQRTSISSTRQKHRMRSLKASFTSRETYWTRNLIMIERGTHPRMRFRADLKDLRSKNAQARTQRIAARQAESRNRQESAMNEIYEQYIEARRSCGQSTDLSLDAVRDALQRQSKTIKSTYRCKEVKFRVAVEDGKAKVKAVPVR